MALVKKNIYPEIEVIRSGNTLKMRTTLRKKHRGKWYLWNFERRAYVKEGEGNLSGAISSFNRDIYLCMLFGKVDTKVRYSNGIKVYRLDEDQQDEKTRVKPTQLVNLP